MVVKKCSEKITWGEIGSFRLYCQELTKDEPDLVIKTELLAQRNTSACVEKNEQKRLRPKQTYMFRGKRICRNLYCFLHDVGKQKVQVIGRALDQNGLTARVHGNTNRQPIHSLTFNERQNVLEFIKRYASENAIVLPGRLPYV